MRFEVETASLAHTISSMDTELDKIAKVTKKLYSALLTLDGMWDGPSHDTFQMQYAQDQQVLGQLGTRITQVVQGLEDARKDYEQCEQSVKTEVSKIRI
ncbi:MAG: WXG100 family type VII secretion target [Oscillospiraceae bacterium]|nr:WXG100 family type VII secretion target [Oscillospiraceae bacterium]MBQ5711467.1 WXG100 family type VII secretion target [Oscillospiraceae bacterium]